MPISIYEQQDFDLINLINKIKAIYLQPGGRDLSGLKSIINSYPKNELLPDQILSILENLNQQQKTLPKGELSTAIQMLLAEQLSKINEALFSTDDGSAEDCIQKALTNLKNELKFSEDYSSPEHQYFCKKWRVFKERDDYPLWDELVNSFKENFDNDCFGAVCCHLLIAVGGNPGSNIINTSALDYNQETFDPIKTSPYKVDLKNFEIQKEIFTGNNFFKLVRGYLREYANGTKNPDLINTKIANIEKWFNEVGMPFPKDSMHDFKALKREILREFFLLEENASYLDLFRHNDRRNKPEVPTLAKHEIENHPFNRGEKEVKFHPGLKGNWLSHFFTHGNPTISSHKESDPPTLKRKNYL
ncbi:MAG: hypothetical protein H0W64_05600 [Gammaproteobacteria bacterium]|nr:hypothetical protein [Gammaproteobacteria bacterium]